MRLRRCECVVCRYHCFHIRDDGEIFSHSQNSFDAMKNLRSRGYRFVTLPIARFSHDLSVMKA